MPTVPRNPQTHPQTGDLLNTPGFRASTEVWQGWLGTVEVSFTASTTSAGYEITVPLMPFHVNTSTGGTILVNVPVGTWERAEEVEALDAAEIARREAEARRAAAASARTALITRNRNRARELKAKFAERRAVELLKEHLDEEQLADFARSRDFHVTTPGGNVYRIGWGVSGNIVFVRGAGIERHGYALVEGNRLCGHIDEGGIPTADHMLAQKLALEYDESGFVHMANVS